MTKVLVTGATGFIGQAVTRRLVAEGLEVIGTTRGRRELPRAPAIRYIDCDFTRKDGLESADPALFEVDLVVHLAAERRVWSLSDGELWSVNVASGARLLRRTTRARRYIFVSSLAVYGSGRREILDADSPLAPTGRYGWSKVAAEKELSGAAEETETPLTIVRPGVVYGPGDRHGMIANLARLLTQRRFLLVGNGTSRLGPLYVDDLAEAISVALRSDSSNGRRFVLSGEEMVTTSDLVELVARAVGRSAPTVRVPEPVARSTAWMLEASYRLLGTTREPFVTREKIDRFTRDQLVDLSRAREALGYRPRTGLRSGIEHTVEWLRSCGELP